MYCADGRVNAKIENSPFVNLNSCASNFSPQLSFTLVKLVQSATLLGLGYPYILYNIKY